MRGVGLREVGWVFSWFGHVAGLSRLMVVIIGDVVLGPRGCWWQVNVDLDVVQLVGWLRWRELIGDIISWRERERSCRQLARQRARQRSRGTYICNSKQRRKILLSVRMEEGSIKIASSGHSKNQV